MEIDKSIKHSTFWRSGYQFEVYTTFRLTPHHQFLREKYNGKTYEHPADAILHFIMGMPLEKPLKVNREIS